VATLPESVDYTDKDFDALRGRLVALVKSVFPDWTDFDVASFGNLLVELYAFVGDVPASRLFLRQGYGGSDVRDRLRANLSGYFRVSEGDGTPNPLVDFGFNIKDAEGNSVGEIAWSDLFNVIRERQAAVACGVAAAPSALTDAGARGRVHGGAALRRCISRSRARRRSRSRPGRSCRSP
jgi:hypothetical protein